MKRNPKVGDYIIAKDKSIFRITNIELNGSNLYYTIKNLNSNESYIESYNYKLYNEYKGLTHSHIRHLGVVIPEEDMSSTIKLLYES